MKKKSFCMGMSMLAAFGVWTAAVRLIDVKAIGPLGSLVGLAGMNGFFHNLTGVHLSLYGLTNWLSIIPLGMVITFAMLGLYQWITRKQLRKVDGSLLVLGAFYAVIMAIYVFFRNSGDQLPACFDSGAVGDILPVLDNGACDLCDDDGGYAVVQPNQQQGT